MKLFTSSDSAQYFICFRWWKGLDFARRLPFARDRVVECFFWIVGVYFEPQYSLARKILTKVIAMTSIIDGIYDVYQSKSWNFSQEQWTGLLPGNGSFILFFK